MRLLTTRQIEILKLIQDAIERTGFPPTRAEIATILGFRSPNAAEEHLRALAKKGAIELSSGTSRGIRILVTNQTRLLFPASDTSTPTSKHASTEPHILPLIGRVAAGSPILAQEHIERTYQVDPTLFSGHADYLLKVRGMSMRDIGILEDDLLAIQKTDQARNGQIIVARLDDEVTVKRYQRTHTQIELIPENSDFCPIYVPLDAENFFIEGRVVGLIRPFS